LQQVLIDGQSYSQWRVPDGRVVGWHETSARIGQADNLVLNGHHNIQGHVFADLIQVEVGQSILLSAADRSTRQYTVVQTLLLEEEGQPAAQRLQNARWLLPSHDERITLVTCWPPDGRSHRLVVVALPSDFVEQTNP
jgi:sortase A